MGTHGQLFCRAVRSEACKDAQVQPEDNPSDVDPPKPGRKHLAFMGLGMLLGFVLGLAVFTIRLPYVSLEPGTVLATEPVISITGETEHPSPGEVHFVTSVERRLTAATWLVAVTSDGVDIFHVDAFSGGDSLEDQRAVNAGLLNESQNAAAHAAAVGKWTESASAAAQGAERTKASRKENRYDI